LHIIQITRIVTIEKLSVFTLTETNYAQQLISTSQGGPFNLIVGECSPANKVSNINPPPDMDSTYVE
jgi:hypothetical protein